MSAKGKLATIEEGKDGEIEYCCVSCPARTTDKEKLELHMVLHNKEYRFLCGICGTGLKRKEHLDRHTLGHQEVRPHICPVCNKGFKRKEHLNIHFSIHSGDKTHLCPLCHRSFYRKDHLQKHLQTHSKLFMEQNLHSITISDQDFMEMKQEVMDDDDDVKPIIIGDGSCEIMIQSDEEKNTTVPSPVKFDKERPFACPICHKTYKRKDHLKLHSYTHQEKDKICSECGKAFHKDVQLLSHMSVHLKPAGPQESVEDLPPVQTMLIEHTDIDIIPLDTSDLLIPRALPEYRPHECPICHRKFKRRQHLKVHANVHMKRIPPPTIWCSLCNAGFQNNSQFENHQCMSADQSDSGERYEDEQSEQVDTPQDAKKENSYPPEFLELVESADHDETPMIVLSEEQHIPTPQRVYVCKWCSKPFKRKDHYKIHLHIHTGIKSFFCPDCGKGFYRKDHLQKHATIHLKVKPTSKLKKEIPDLFPINMLSRKNEVKPEITITAPSNTKLRVPLQIKVPYQVVMAMDNGEQRAVTIDPQASGRAHEILS